MLINNKNKYTAQFILSAFLVISGIIMLFVGMFIPPVGMIDQSILIAYGEISTFAGSLCGIDYSYKIKVLNHKNGDKDYQGEGNNTTQE